MYSINPWISQIKHFICVLFQLPMQMKALLLSKCKVKWIKDEGQKKIGR